MHIRSQNHTIMGTFELFKDKKGDHRFRLRAANNEPILASEGYNSRAAAENGIASVKRNATTEARYDRKETKAGWSFNLKAANHKVIGTSEVYSSSAARENGIDAVRKNAPKAPVQDLT